MTLRYTEMNDLGFGITMNITKSLYKGKSEFQDIEILETEGLGKMLLWLSPRFENYFGILI